MSTHSFENLLLKFLIEDLDSNHCVQKPTKFSTFVKNYELSQQSRDSNSLSSTNSNDESSTHSSPPAKIPQITQKEIFSSLANQKTAIFLQGSIRGMSSEEISQFITQIQGHFALLMNDKNGNYLCSDLFKSCTPIQRIKVIQEIYNEIDNISTNEFGTHPMQTLIELAKTNEEFFLLTSAFSDQEKLAKVALNPNGSYVIQKIIVNIPETFRGNFNYYLLSILHILARDMYGVCTAKKFVIFAQNKILMNEIIQKILTNLIVIAKNQYGNYLIQYLLEIWWNKPEMTYFKQLITKYFCQFSMNQYASHISEIYIKMLSSDDRKRLLTFLLKNGSYAYLMKDKYGIFVMNKLSMYNSKKFKKM